MTTLAEINKTLQKNNEALGTIATTLKASNENQEKTAADTALVARRMKDWLEGEKSKRGDQLEAERKAARAKTTRAQPTSFTGGIAAGIGGATGLSAVADFASNALGSLFGNSMLAHNLGARAGLFLGRGAAFGTMALLASQFGESTIQNLFDSLDPNDVAFSDEQKQEISRRAGDGLTGGFVASIFSRNPWIRMAGFVAGAFGDEIYSGIERVFGEEALANTTNPLAQFGIGPDTLDFSQGPLKEALVFAVPLLAVGLIKSVGKALVTRLAVPLTAGAAVGILESLGWTGLANLINQTPDVPTRTPGFVPPSMRTGGGLTAANRLQQGIQRIAGLSDEAIAALREMGYGVNRAGALYDLKTGGGVLSADRLDDILNQVDRPGVFARAGSYLSNTRLGRGFSSLANSRVGQAGRFLGRWAGPLATVFSGGMGYYDEQFNEAGMTGLDRVSSGVASDLIGGTADVATGVGAWTINKLFGTNFDPVSLRDVMRDAAAATASGDTTAVSGYGPLDRLLTMGRMLGADLAGGRREGESIFDYYDRTGQPIPESTGRDPMAALSALGGSVLPSGQFNISAAQLAELGIVPQGTGPVIGNIGDTNTNNYTNNQGLILPSLESATDPYNGGIGR